MLKIAIISTVVPETHYTRYLVSGLYEKGTKVSLLVDDLKENDLYIDQNPNLDVNKIWRPGFKFPYFIVKYVIKSHVDIIHFQHEFNMYGGVKGVPSFLLTLFLLRVLGKKIVVTSHAVVNYKEMNKAFLETFALQKFESIDYIVRAGFRFFYIFMALFAHKIIVHSNYTKKVYVESYKVRSSKVEVIPIGIAQGKRSLSRKYFPESEWYKSIKQKRIILFFGYLLKRKGLNLLIRAYSKSIGDLKNSVLVLAGGILNNQRDYVTSLKKLVDRENIVNSVVFTNFLEELDIHYLYKNCDFVVLPYTESISSSLPLSQAFEHGKPVLASDIGTLKDEISDGRNGLFFKNKDEKDLCRKLIKLYNDNELLEKLQAGAVKERDSRSWDKVAEITTKIYKSL